MIYSGLEIKGHQNKKLEQVVQYFRKNNINTLRDIEDIKRDNIKVFKFWNETGVDIASLEIKKYTSEERNKSKKPKYIDRTYEIEETIGFMILKVVMSGVIFIAVFSYLIVFLGLPIVKMI